MEQKGSPKPPDHSDQKAMNNLMSSLQKLTENAKKQDPESQKPSSPSTSKKSDKKKRKLNENYPKITTWLCKQSRKGEESKRPKALDITVNKSEGKKSKFERTPSFEKYGFEMPTFEKIKEDHKRLDEYKNQVKALDSINDDVLGRSFNSDCLQESQKFSGEILDCKHLTLDQLSEHTQKNMPILKEIMSEERFSERHQIYHKFHRKDLLRAKDLKCSPSLVVFTQEQKDHMLNLMREELDPKDVLTNYFFQVLLPELCLFIFMECHNMSKRKASRYLDERPIDI